MNIFLIFLVFIILCLIISSNKSCQTFSGGRRKHIHSLNVWDDNCLYRYRDLDDTLYDYETKKIGDKLRKFIKWYKPSISGRCIMNYLLKNKFTMYSVKLRTYKGYIDIRGHPTRNEKLIAPHFIFINKDHSCVRMKPIVGGEVGGYTPFPTISFSIVLDPKDESTFRNEAFKVTRDGKAIPKAGPNHADACMNDRLSEFEIQKLMKTTHIKIPLPSTKDICYFKNFKLDD